jgi:adenosylhomocysteine nucleosidase
MDMPSHKVAIVAALEREIWPLVKDWPVQRREYDGRWFKFFEKDGMVLVCGGIGSEAARRSAEAIIGLYQPALIISAGFAGGLDPALPAGHTMIARHVIDASDSSHIDSGMGEGVLVSFESVAGTEQKAKLAEAYGAHAVDMEAAAVARSAEAHGVKFLACKVISDASDSRALPIGRFITADGRFHAIRFLLHVAVRPWLWTGVQKLARDSALAAGELCRALAGTQAPLKALYSGVHSLPESKA